MTKRSRLGLLVALHFGRRLAVPLLSVAAYCMVAAWIVEWELTRAGPHAGGFWDRLYEFYTQLFFQPVAVLPKTPLAALLYTVTPLVGVGLVAQGVVKVGADLLDADEREHLWVRLMSGQMTDHVVVCGLGHVGYRVVEALKQLGQEVVAVERKEEDSFYASVRALGVPVIVGDARRDELLVEAGVERARAVVCATDDDLANLEIAVDAKRMNPKIRVVMRMFDQRLANKMGGALELDSTFSTSALAAPLVALQASQEGVESVYRSGSELRAVFRVALPAVAPAGTVADLEERWNVRIIGERASDGSVRRMRADEKIAPGRELLCDGPAEAVGRIRTSARA